MSIRLLKERWRLCVKVKPSNESSSPSFDQMFVHSLEVFRNWNSSVKQNLFVLLYNVVNVNFPTRFTTVIHTVFKNDQSQFFTI